MLEMLMVFFAIVICFCSLSYFKTLVNNVKRRKVAENYYNTLSENEGDSTSLEDLIEKLNFPLTTIECNKQIESVRDCVIKHKEEINLFCAIIDISTCFHNVFAMVGNFVGTEIIPSKYENRSISKLYSANILFRKNADNTLTLLSTFPEDKDHDFFIKDLILRINEFLK